VVTFPSSLLTFLFLVLTLAVELEALIVKETEQYKTELMICIIFGYYLIGLNGYVEGGYYPRE